MAKYNTNNGCGVCGDPAKQKCSRCGAVRYCDAGNTLRACLLSAHNHPVCQKEDWKSHRPLCNSWQGAKWQGLTFIAADQHAPGAYSLRINRYDNVQHNDMAKRVELAKHNPGPPVNTHGAMPFIVKVQINSSSAHGPAHPLFAQSQWKDGSDLLIYDQRRTIDVMVLRASSEEAHFNAVAEIVKTKGERGLKAFCWAIRTGEWTIDICLDQFPEFQMW